LGHLKAGFLVHDHSRQRDDGDLHAFCPGVLQVALSPDNTRFETTPATELHAVGYMFYELLTGRGPFPFAANEVELMRTIITMDRGNGLNTPSELNHASPKELDAVVMRLLEKQPDKRYQSGEELAMVLDELLARAPANWDSPLDVPAVLGSNGATRADRGSCSTAFSSFRRTNRMRMRCRGPHRSRFVLSNALALCPSRFPRPLWRTPAACASAPGRHQGGGREAGRNSPCAAKPAASVSGHDRSQRRPRRRRCACDSWTHGANAARKPAREDPAAGAVPG